MDRQLESKPEPTTSMHSSGQLTGGASLLVAGGLCGVASVIAYLATQLPPLQDAWHGLPVTGSRAAIVVAWWLAVGFPVLAIITVHTLYRVLGTERAGALNSMALIFGVAAFVTITIMLVVQGGIQLQVDRLAKSASSTELARWNEVARAAHGVDLGIDVAWDLFLGLWMLFLAAVMWRHSRFGPVWAVAAMAIAVPFLSFNAVTVPFPPATEGLVDLGPVTGIYFLVVSG